MAPEASTEAYDAGHGQLMAPGAVAVQESYRHEAFFWSGEDEFLAGTVPFIREGIEAGEPILVAVTTPRLQSLTRELGSDAAAVRLCDMTELGLNPARIIPAWLAFVAECAVGGQQVRGIGEPIWSGRRPAEVHECEIHESLLNVALEPDTPLWLRCPYDVDALDADVVAEARRTHPDIVGDGPAHRSKEYAGSSLADTLFRADLPPVRDPSFVRTFSPADLRSVRHEVLRLARAAGVSVERSADLALAMHELATNSLLHALGEGVLRIWREVDALVCEVRDLGQIDDPLTGRRKPSVTSQGGRGLWMVNQLCDLVQVRSHASGTTVRVHTWL